MPGQAMFDTRDLHVGNRKLVTSFEILTSYKAGQVWLLHCHSSLVQMDA